GIGVVDRLASHVPLPPCTGEEECDYDSSPVHWMSPPRKRGPIVRAEFRGHVRLGVRWVLLTPPGALRAPPSPSRGGRRRSDLCRTSSRWFGRGPWAPA